MEWSKAKNILIAILLVVDIFLLGTYIFRAETEKNEKEALRSEVCKVLKKQGINVSKEIIPLDSIEFNPATIGLRGKKRENAQLLLGDVSEIVDEEYTTFSGERGTFMFSKDSFSLVYESGKQIFGTESAKTLAKEIASALSIETDDAGIICKKDDGGYTVIVPQVFSEMELFDCDVEIKISESGSVIARGSYICDGAINTYSDDILPVSAVMLSFADEVKANGFTEVNVKDIRIGYTAKASDNKRLSLAPTLGIETDCGLFLVDMQTEKVYVE